MKKSIFLSIFLFLTIASFGQETEKVYVQGLFRGTHVINGQSAETQRAGDLDFYIGHRFGAINLGFYEWFGLDQATMRTEFAYGITDWLSVGIGRTTKSKEYDSFLKARVLRQSNVMPISVTYNGGFYVSGVAPDANLPLLFKHRMSFSNQLLIAKKFSDRLSIQVMPTHVHINLVDMPTDPNDIFSLGIGARVQVTKNVALTTEYYYTPDALLSAGNTRPLSFGVDINTGNHVFQLHVTNTSFMQEKAIISNTNGSWTNGDIMFGFNMVRTFKLKGTRY
jgi:opacity protein-like surface antigen